MIYIGVDPGKSGGYAVVGSDASAKAYPWDDERFVNHMKGATIMRDMEGHKLVACVEKVGAHPGQGVTSMFTFGQGFGYILGVLAALGIGVQLVPPGTWKKEFSLIGKDKAASIAVCKRLFPGVDLRPTEKCRKDSDGMAEALLMAEYARRKF